jgi:hypothetical protein
VRRPQLQLEFSGPRNVGVGAVERSVGERLPAVSKDDGQQRQRYRRGGFAVVATGWGAAGG